ncbi:hypothetical protein PS15m_010827 [Mucor circinelloides]
MAKSDSSDDENDSIFDVEEIVQMFVTDNGERMFEIKWKGYPPEENTYEPEHNLNCPELLKAFLEKHKRKEAQRAGSSALTSTSSSSLKKKDKQKLRVSFDLTDDNNTHNGSQKTSVPGIFSSDEDDEPIALSSKKGKSKEKLAENKPSKDKGKPKDKSKGASKQQSSSSSSTIPKYSDLQFQQRSQDEQHKPKKPSSGHPFPPKSNNIPSKPSLYIHKDHTPSNSSSSSSFLNFKRSLAPKSLQPVEIGHILNTINNTNGTFRPNNPVTSKPPPSTRPTPMPVSTFHNTNHPPSTNTTPPTTPTSQTQFRANPRMTDSTQQRQHQPQPQPQPQTQPQPQPQPQPLPQPLPQPHQRPPSALPLHQPFHHQIPTSVPIKRQSSRPDPRLIANERKKFRLSNNEPFTIEALLRKGNDEVCKVTLNGVAEKVPQFDRIKHLLHLQNPQGTEVTVNSFLPLKRFSDYLTAERTKSFMSVMPLDQFIQAGKLRNFMSVNEIIGVVYHPDMPREALFIMAARDVSKVSNLPSDTGFENARADQLFAIFVDNLPPRPPLNFDHIDYVDETDQMFTWRQVCRYLRFPPQLQNLYHTTTFLVYGHSESSIMLTKACMTLPAVTRRPTNVLVPHNIMMFDRFNNDLQHKSLLKHKREPVTQIWEFGIPNFYYGDIEPACEVFPQHSGGFVTTDAANIVHNPHIIEGICNQIKRFNDVPVAFGEWKFVLPHNFLQSLKQMLQDGHNSVAIQEALIFITIALSNGDIEIMRTWPEEKEEPNSIVFMKHVLREYYKTHQYFVYVDDIESVPLKSKEMHVSIDFVTTDTIFRTFA